MTKGNRKNSNVKIIKDVKIHNYWEINLRRNPKAQYCESAFDSKSDKKIEYSHLSKDPVYLKKYLLQNYIEIPVEN